MACRWWWQIVDIRSVRPLDAETVRASVARTGRLVVADTSWGLYGLSAEVAAVAAEMGPGTLRAPVRRVTTPDCPAPVSWPLEEAFHPRAEGIAEACLASLGRNAHGLRELDSVTSGFTGPF